MVPYTEILKTGLPIANAWVRFFDPPLPVCVLGPSIDQIKYFAPDLFDLFTSDEDEDTAHFHREINQQSDLKSIIEAQWAWQTWDNSSLVIISVPELSKDQFHRLPKTLRTELIRDQLDIDPNLLLASLFMPNSTFAVDARPFTLLLMDGQSLDGKRAMGFCKAHADTYFSKFASMSTPTGSALLRTFRDGKVRCGGDSPANSDDRVQKEWKSKQLSRIPAFSWLIAIQPDDSKEPNETISILGLDVSCKYWDTVHFRQFTEDNAGVLSSDAGMKKIMSIVDGTGERNEDDVLVPLDDVLVSGCWSASNLTQRGIIWKKFASSKGYEQKTIEGLSSSIDELSEWEEGIKQDGVIWINSRITEKQSELIVFGRTLAKDDPAKEEKVGQASLTAPAKSETSRVLRVESANAEFLCRVINDDGVQQDLRCRSYGSFKQPILTRIVLSETMVAWPSEDERKRLLDIQEKYTSIAENISDGASDLSELVDRVNLALKGAASYSPEDQRPEAVSPFHLDVLWDESVEQFEKIRKTFEDGGIPLSRDLQGKTENTTRYPPAPVALLKRRLQYEKESSRKLKYAFLLAEMLVKYDCFLMIVSLEAMGWNRWADIHKSMNSPSGKMWRPTFGTWCSFQRQLRRSIRSEDAQEKTTGEESSIKGLIADVSFRKIDDLTKPLVESRNERSHGSLQSREIDNQLFEKTIHPQLKKLKSILGYHENFQLVSVQRIQKKRNETLLNFVELSHDNPEFAVNSFSRPPGTVLDNLTEKEVYVIFDEQFLQISPFILYEPPEDGGAPVLSIFSSYSDNKAKYTPISKPDLNTLSYPYASRIKERLGLGG